MVGWRLERSDGGARIDVSGERNLGRNDVSKEVPKLDYISRYQAKVTVTPKSLSVAFGAQGQPKNAMGLKRRGCSEWQKLLVGSTEELADGDTLALDWVARQHAGSTFVVRTPDAARAPPVAAPAAAFPPPAPLLSPEPAAAGPSAPPEPAAESSPAVQVMGERTSEQRDAEARERAIDLDSLPDAPAVPAAHAAPAAPAPKRLKTEPAPAAASAPAAPAPKRLKIEPGLPLHRKANSAAPQPKSQGHSDDVDLFSRLGMIQFPTQAASAAARPAAPPAAPPVASSPASHASAPGVAREDPIEIDDSDTEEDEDDAEVAMRFAEQLERRRQAGLRRGYEAELAAKTPRRQCCRYDGLCFQMGADHWHRFAHPKEVEKPFCPNLLQSGKCEGLKNRRDKAALGSESDSDDPWAAHCATFSHGPLPNEIQKTLPTNGRVSAPPPRPPPTPRTYPCLPIARGSAAAAAASAAPSAPAAAAAAPAPAAIAGMDALARWEKGAKAKHPKPQGGVLVGKFGAPPFSTLDAKQGYWQTNNRQWKALGLDSGQGRDEELLGAGMKRLAQAAGSNTLTGTSIFDPTLCQCLLNWFCPRAKIVARRQNRPVIVVDPFAGGSVRGIVASKLGLLYVGVELSQKQIDANKQQLTMCSDCAYPPLWVHGDGEDVVALFRQALQLPQYAGLGLGPATPCDMVLSCPPYFNLEKYDGGANDLSMMGSYALFKGKYRRIIAAASSLLRNGHLASFVIGNVRNKDGAMHNLHADTCTAFEDAGMVLVNDAVLLTPIGTAAMRANRTTSAGSKLVTTHQNVVVFSKGQMLTPQDARNSGIRASNESQQESQ